MKVSYFAQEKPDADDILLEMAKGQGYTPAGCLLGGMVVMSEINKDNSPCWAATVRVRNAADIRSATSIPQP